MSQRFPHDLTRLHNVALRKQMSFWKAQLGRAEYVHAMACIDELGLKVQCEQAERRFRAVNQEFKTKWSADAALSENPVYDKAHTKLQLAKAKAMMTKGIVSVYSHYWDSLSRELAARISDGERESRDRPQ
jgi:hypothetical protein